MTAQTSDSATVTEVLPKKRQLPLKGLYLGQDLARISTQTKKPLVTTTYLTDRDGIIAKADDHGHFQVPPETRNASDWRLSQELMAQADVIISGGDYLRRVATPGSHAQDILHQFEPGGEFEELGEWRVRAGYKRRSPDLAVVTRHLDFRIPERVLRSGRRTSIITTYAMANSAQAKALGALGTAVVGSDEADVDGNQMIDYLGDKEGARVIVMVSGPGVLQLLLAAKRLDLLYITQVQREIPFDDPTVVKRLLPDGNMMHEPREFRLTHQYSQDHVLTADGSVVSQFFLRYDKS